MRNNSIARYIEQKINPFQANVPVPYHLKTESVWLPAVLRGYRKRTLVWDGRSNIFASFLLILWKLLLE